MKVIAENNMQYCKNINLQTSQEQTMKKTTEDNNKKYNDKEGSHRPS